MVYIKHQTNSLKLLSKEEMELAFSINRIIETIAPVHSEKPNHRQEDSHADTGRPLYLERIEVFYIGPSITAFKEG